MSHKEDTRLSSGDLLYIKNCSREGPGFFGVLGDQQGLRSTTVDVERGESFPDPKDWKAVIVLGGPRSANDADQATLAELDFVRKVLDAGIPYLGICLGMQFLAKAAGAAVQKHALKEIGAMGPDRLPFSMALSPEGRADRLFKGFGTAFPPVKQGATSVVPVFQLHGETIVMPEGTDKFTLLASGLFCTNQAIRVGEKAWGIQGHVELNQALLETWAKEDADLRDKDRIGVLRDYAALSKDYERAARLIFENFMAVANS